MKRPRPDGYWPPTSSKGKKTTPARLRSTSSASPEPMQPEPISRSPAFDPLWLEILWINYGPFGPRLQRRDGCAGPAWQADASTPAKPPLAGRGRLLGVCGAYPLASGARRSRPEVFGAVMPAECSGRGHHHIVNALAVSKGVTNHPANGRALRPGRLLCAPSIPQQPDLTACGTADPDRRRRSSPRCCGLAGPGWC